MDINTVLVDTIEQLQPIAGLRDGVSRTADEPFNRLDAIDKEFAALRTWLDQAKADAIATSNEQLT